VKDDSGESVCEKNKKNDLYCGCEFERVCVKKENNSSFHTHSRKRLTPGERQSPKKENDPRKRMTQEREYLLLSHALKNETDSWIKTITEERE